ncbi:MAG: hypothetical protein HFJ91_09380 [Muribaculaceae bacterium]|nr:hypothetical protein [Muribaculaceae bacterium]
MGRGLVGCVPLAIGQICSYYKSPESYGGITFDWDAITAYPTIHYASNSVREQITRTLARIGKDIGVHHGLSTGATMYQTLQGLENVGFSSYKTSKYATSEEVEEYFRRGGVTLILGRDPKTDIGHAWVADGFKSVRLYKAYYKNCYAEPNFISDHVDRKCYMTFNWGWGYKDNAYYLVGHPYEQGSHSFDIIDYIYNLNNEIGN